MGNDPWFILTREHAISCINFSLNDNKLCSLICQGGLANESLFAIILMHSKKMQHVIPEVTHVADWVRMSSPTSPHMFKEGNEMDIAFIEDNLEKHKYAMFIRKVHPEFPDEILRKYIYQKDNMREISENKSSTWITRFVGFSRNVVPITNFWMVLVGFFIGGWILILVVL